MKLKLWINIQFIDLSIDGKMVFGDGNDKLLSGSYCYIK